MRLVYKIPLGISIFLTLNWVCRSLAGDFDPLVTSDVAFLVVPEVTPGPEIRSVLRRPFRYLGKGHQAFAFVSEDGEYVLKLFRSRLPSSSLPLRLINSLKLPFSRRLLQTFWKDLYEKTTAQSFASYGNGYTLFRPESQVEYVHLKKTGCFTDPIRLFDKIGVARTLDPDTCCFLLQKRVEPIAIGLKRLLQQEDREQIRSILTSFVDLLARRSSLGFYRPTHKFGENFGSIGPKLFQLDVGNLVRPGDPGVPDSAVGTELSYSLDKLRTWTAERFPSLLSDLEEVIAFRGSLP